MTLEKSQEKLYSVNNNALAATAAYIAVLYQHKWEHSNHSIT